MIRKRPQPALGVLVPEYPGQTHGFFWRESQWLRQFGFRVEMVSTRLPTVDAAARHDWAEEARREASYLMPLGGVGVGKVILESLRSLHRCPRLLRRIVGLEAASATDRIRQLALGVMALRLRQDCRLRNIRHLHVHSCADSALLATLCRDAGGPSYSLVLHSPISCFGRNQRAKWSSADFGVVVSNFVGEELRERCGDVLPADILVSSMGFDEEVFVRSMPYRAWTAGEVLRLSACSRVTRGKGIDTLINVVALLNRSGIDAQLEVAGGGDSGVGSFMGECEHLAERMGVGARVRFIGSCSAIRIRDMLEQSHAFVTATRQEAIGVAIMEAMAMQLPVVATRVGGVPELIEDGVSGILVPVDAPQAMADAIRLLVSTAGRMTAVGSAAKSRVRGQFSSRRSAERLAEILRSRHPELAHRDP